MLVFSTVGGCYASRCHSDGRKINAEPWRCKKKKKKTRLPRPHSPGGSCCGAILTAGKQVPPLISPCMRKQRRLSHGGQNNGEYYFLGFSQRSGRWRIHPPTSAAFTERIKGRIFQRFPSEKIHRELLLTNHAASSASPSCQEVLD